MPALDVEYAAAAADDLLDLIDYIVECGGHPDVAERFVHHIQQRCRLIAEAPQAGLRRDDLYPELRTIAFDRTTLIAYLANENAIGVIRVLHRGRDTQTAFWRLPCP